MSDFDKEAERERLREKYEREEEKREVTERMSELLLKGATMTNAHCQECGDPIFRYDGQEFCATCQRTVKRDTGDDEDEETGGEANGDQEEIEVASPEETHVQFGGEETDAAEAQTDRDGDAAPSGVTNRPAEPEPDRQPATETDRGSRQPSRQAGAGEIDAGDLAAAGDSLARSVTDLARRSEGTDDLGRKRELLAATREAAEALSAVREAGR